MMFGSIMCLQILAHLPLANINLPANTQQSFEIIISIVSFDYFPLTDVVDFGFTETEPQSDKFELLGYETSNFIEGMGSIMLFFWAWFIYIILVALISCKRRRLQLKQKHKYFDAMKAWDSCLNFLQGTFFEAMVCVSVSMKQFAIFDFLNSSDKFSMVNHLLVTIIMVLFVGLITFFTLFRLPKLAELYDHTYRQKKKEHLNKARQTFKDNLKTHRANLGGTK